jgi:glutamate racemase
LQLVLNERGLLCKESNSKGQIKYLVTDSVSRFQSIGAIFLGEPLDSQAIELVDI